MGKVIWRKILLGGNMGKSFAKELLKVTKICLKDITSEYGVWQQPYKNMSVGVLEYFYKNRSYLFM